MKSDLRLVPRINSIARPVVFKGLAAQESLQDFPENLTHSFPMHPFSTPLKTSRVHWERMG